MIRIERLTLLLTVGALLMFKHPVAVAGEAAPAAATSVEAPASEIKPAPKRPDEEKDFDDFLWMMVAGFLVFFMQAGFAMVETGFTRAKNTANILMKNLMDFCIGSLAYWAVGFAFMYGVSIGGIIGFSNFFLSDANPAGNNWAYADWFFQVVFAATAATIVSGAMAERTKFSSYLIYSAAITAFIYPLVGHWTWGGGWLSKLGFHDFAGSTIVHSTGGWCALVGAAFLGARLGKFGPDGKPRAIPGHNLALGALGVFVLWLGWFGFNPGSTLGADVSFARIAVTTNLAAAAGAMATLFLVWRRYGKPDPTFVMNGALAGLVAITAPCAVVSPVSAVIIGALAGVLVVFSVEFIERGLHIDDPVGAVSVHGVCGAWGTIAVGLFADKAYSGEFAGLFFGGGLSQFGAQLAGVAAVFVFCVIASTALFGTIKATAGLRVSPEEEMEGLDISEHGLSAYPDFVMHDVIGSPPTSPPPGGRRPVSAESDYPTQEGERAVA